MYLVDSNVWLERLLDQERSDEVGRFLDNVTSNHLLPEDTHRIAQIMNKYNMDFDDAYQYIAAEKYNLIIISFDNDFNRTKLGKKYPSEATIK